MELRLVGLAAIAVPRWAGRRVLYNTLAPQTSYQQGTYLSHPWILVSGDTCYGIFLPGSLPSSVTVP